MPLEDHQELFYLDPQDLEDQLKPVWFQKTTGLFMSVQEAYLNMKSQEIQTLLN